MVGGLKYERPFLWPSHRFQSIHPRGAVCGVPATVKFIVHYLSHQLQRCRDIPCVAELRSSDVSSRVDPDHGASWAFWLVCKDTVWKEVSKEPVIMFSQDACVQYSASSIAGYPEAHPHS